MRNGSSGKNLLKSVGGSIRHGNAVEVTDSVQKWSRGEEEPLPEWDLVIGAALWNRCVDTGIVATEDEITALEEVYKCLVQVFSRQKQDTDNYMERIKVLGATLKFLVQHKRLNLDVIEDLLQEISKSSFYVRQKDMTNFKVVCLNFYALIWNYMREHQQSFATMESLAHASLSIRWLVVLGLEQFQNISHKLYQLSFLLAKAQPKLNSTVADFFGDISHKIVNLMKETIKDDANHGVRVKKGKKVVPVSDLYGILNLTFVLTRQLVTFGDFDKAQKVFRPITSIAKVYFDLEITEVWKKILLSYVKISMILMNGVDQKLTDDVLKSSESFRECRKQILDLKFQKAYPGYAFCFMYTFTESIGYSVSNSRNVNSNASSQEMSPLITQLSLPEFCKFLKEIQFAADACVVLDVSKSGKNSFEGITDTRKVDVESNALFYVLKFASERISDKDAKIGKDVQQITEACFSTLMSLASRDEIENQRSAELYNLLTFHTCNIGYAYQKRKDYKEAMSWCYRSIDAYEAFKSKNVEMDLKISALSIGLLLADCHRQMADYKEGLRWLSKWLLMAPQYVNSQSTAYDIYEQIPWSDWSVHWQSIQKELCSRDPTNCQSVVEYLEEDDPSSVSDKFASKVLRLEMNAYFAGRQTVVPAMINVGQQLEANNFCLADKVLGLVCQAVGLWWVSTEESLGYAIAMLNEAIGNLDQQSLTKGGDGKGGEALRVYLSGIVFSWKAMCVMKHKQFAAEGQLVSLKEKFIKENPEKFKDKVDDSYAMTGFSSLTIADEIEWASSLIQAAECFYQLSQMEDVFKNITDVHCPALAQITVRLVALGLSALGDKVNSVKAWHSTFTIAKLYDRKGLTVLAASEILKILPNSSLECIQYAEKVNKTAWEGKLIKHNKAVYYRLDLSKAHACYQNRNYEEGLRHLAVVYKFLGQKDNFDSTHHLMAEADYVLSLYRSVQLSQDLKFPVDLPEMLCKMTPAGLAVKGCKLIAGLSRNPDVLTSGWTDLFHNFYLLNSIGEITNRAVNLLKETGKLRELKSFTTDAIYFFQKLGIVSRSVAMLIPLIEIDISARNFCLAQIRIDAIANVLLAGDCKEEEEAPPFAEAKEFLQNHLKIPGLSINRLENVSNLKWHLGDIDAVSFHYKNRSSKYLTSLKKDCEEINIKSKVMQAPSFLRHPLTCCCYTCAHLEIIPKTIEFLVSQAKYAVAMRWKISMAVMELTRLHHQRAMFRILFNLEYLTEQLQPIIPRKTGSKALHTIYSHFFFQPGLEMQLASMEICPVDDIAYIVHLMNTSLRAVEILDNQNHILKAHALEIGSAALYEYFFSSGRIPVRDGNIREILRARAEQQEKENTASNASPEVIEQSASPVAPPVLQRRLVQVPLTKQQQYGRKATVTSIRPRRILNNKAQHQLERLSTEVELVDLSKINLDEERNLPIIPPPNFDSDE